MDISCMPGTLVVKRFYFNFRMLPFLFNNIVYDWEMNIKHVTLLDMLNYM